MVLVSKVVIFSANGNGLKLEKNCHPGVFEKIIRMHISHLLDRLDILVEMTQFLTY